MNPSHSLPSSRSFGSKRLVAGPDQKPVKFSLNSTKARLSLVHHSDEEPLDSTRELKQFAVFKSASSAGSRANENASARVHAHAPSSSTSIKSSSGDRIHKAEPSSQQRQSENSHSHHVESEKTQKKESHGDSGSHLFNKTHIKADIGDTICHKPRRSSKDYMDDSCHYQPDQMRYHKDRTFYEKDVDFPAYKRNMTDSVAVDIHRHQDEHVNSHKSRLALESSKAHWEPSNRLPHRRFSQESHSRRGDVLSRDNAMKGLKTFVESGSPEQQRKRLDMDTLDKTARKRKRSDVYHTKDVCDINYNPPCDEKYSRKIDRHQNRSGSADSDNIRTSNNTEHELNVSSKSDPMKSLVEKDIDGSKYEKLEKEDSDGELRMAEASRKRYGRVLSRLDGDAASLQDKSRGKAERQQHDTDFHQKEKNHRVSQPSRLLNVDQGGTEFDESRLCAVGPGKQDKTNLKSVSEKNRFSSERHEASNMVKSKNEDSSPFEKKCTEKNEQTNCQLAEKTLQKDCRMKSLPSKEYSAVEVPTTSKPKAKQRTDSTSSGDSSSSSSSTSSSSSSSSSSSADSTSTSTTDSGSSKNLAKSAEGRMVSEHKLVRHVESKLPSLNEMENSKKSNKHTASANRIKASRKNDSSSSKDGSSSSESSESSSSSTGSSSSSSSGDGSSDSDEEGKHSTWVEKRSARREKLAKHKAKGKNNSIVVEGKQTSLNNSNETMVVTGSKKSSEVTNEMCTASTDKFSSTTNRKTTVDVASLFLQETSIQHENSDQFVKRTLLSAAKVDDDIKNVPQFKSRKVSDHQKSFHLQNCSENSVSNAKPSSFGQVKQKEDLYSPSAPTGWDAGEKESGAPGWSSDSDVDDLSAPFMQVPTSLSSKLQVKKPDLVQTSNEGLRQPSSIECQISCTTSQSFNSMAGSAAVSCSISGTKNANLPLKQDVVPKLHSEPKQSREVIDKTDEQSTVRDKMSSIQQKSVPALGHSVVELLSTTNEIVDSSKNPSRTSTLPALNVDKQSTSSSFMDSLSYATDKLHGESNRHRKVDRASVLNQETHRKDNAKREGYFDVAKSGSRSRESSRSRGDHSSSRSSKIDRRRSRSCERVSRSRSLKENAQKARRKEYLSSDSDSSDDVVFVAESFPVLKESQNSNSDNKKQQELHLKLADESINLDSIPLPQLEPDSIPLPIAPQCDDIPLPPLQSAKPRVNIDSSILSKQSVGIKTCASKLGDVETSADVIEHDIAQSQGIVSSTSQHSPDDNDMSIDSNDDECVESSLQTPQAEHLTNKVDGASVDSADIHRSELNREQCLNQTGAINEVKSDSRIVDTELCDKSTVTPPSKIVLSLADKAKPDTGGLSADSSKWQRKLAGSLLKPVSFKLQLTSTTIGQTSALNEKDEEAAQISSNASDDYAVVSDNRESRNESSAEKLSLVVSEQSSVASGCNYKEHSSSSAQLETKQMDFTARRSLNQLSSTATAAAESPVTSGLPIPVVAHSHVPTLDVCKSPVATNTLMSQHANVTFVAYPPKNIRVSNVSTAATAAVNTGLDEQQAGKEITERAVSAQSVKRRVSRFTDAPPDVTVNKALRSPVEAEQAKSSSQAVLGSNVTKAKDAEDDDSKPSSVEVNVSPLQRVSKTSDAVCASKTVAPVEQMNSKIEKDRERSVEMKQSHSSSSTRRRSRSSSRSKHASQALHQRSKFSETSHRKKWSPERRSHSDLRSRRSRSSSVRKHRPESDKKPVNRDRSRCSPERKKHRSSSRSPPKKRDKRRPSRSSKSRSGSREARTRRDLSRPTRTSPTSKRRNIDNKPDFVSTSNRNCRSRSRSKSALNDKSSPIVGQKLLASRDISSDTRKEPMSKQQHVLPADQEQRVHVSSDRGRTEYKQSVDRRRSRSRSVNRNVSSRNVDMKDSLKKSTTSNSSRFTDGSVYHKQQTDYNHIKMDDYDSRRLESKEKIAYSPERRRSCDRYCDTKAVRAGGTFSKDVGPSMSEDSFARRKLDNCTDVKRREENHWVPGNGSKDLAKISISSFPFSKYSPTGKESWHERSPYSPMREFKLGSERSRQEAANFARRSISPYCVKRRSHSRDRMVQAKYFEEAALESPSGRRHREYSASGRRRRSPSINRNVHINEVRASTSFTQSDYSVVREMSPPTQRRNSNIRDRSSSRGRQSMLRNRRSISRGQSFDRSPDRTTYRRERSSSRGRYVDRRSYSRGYSVERRSYSRGRSTDRRNQQLNVSRSSHWSRDSRDRSPPRNRFSISPPAMKNRPYRYASPPNRRRNSRSRCRTKSASPDNSGRSDVSPSMSLASPRSESGISLIQTFAELDNQTLATNIPVPAERTTVPAISDLAQHGLMQPQPQCAPTPLPFSSLPFSAAHHLPQGATGVQPGFHATGAVQLPYQGMAPNTGWIQQPPVVQYGPQPNPVSFNMVSGGWNEAPPPGMAMAVPPGVLPQLVHGGVYSQSGVFQHQPPPSNVLPVGAPFIGMQGQWPSAQTGSYSISSDSSTRPGYNLPVSNLQTPYQNTNSVSAAINSSESNRPQSPQWKPLPLPERHRDRFRMSSVASTSTDGKSARRVGSDKVTIYPDSSCSEQSVVSSANERDRSGSVDMPCSSPVKPGSATNNQTAVASAEDPRCCCLWETIPEIVVSPSSSGRDTAVTADIHSRRKHSSKTFADVKAGCDSLSTARRRSSRLKSRENQPRDEAGKNTDSDDRQTANDSLREPMTEDETEQMKYMTEQMKSGVTSESESSVSNNDGTEGLRPASAESLTVLPSSNETNAAVKPEKVKSRWRRWSELETGSDTSSSTAAQTLNQHEIIIEESEMKRSEEIPNPPVDEEKQPYYEEIPENIFLSSSCVSKETTKARKEARRMVCNCTPPTSDELSRGFRACDDDCLNRLLMIECGSRCPCGELCTNRQFQRHRYAPVRSFKTDYKGWGLQATSDLPSGTFIMEYVGEVLGPLEFRSRVKRYNREGYQHHYFMALNTDEVIDATKKGNVSRFINHCCDPNCETQKWTVNGQLRIGFFTVKPVKAGEELTFDYQFETYGREATKCYCGASNCRGTIDIGRRSPMKKRGSKMAAKARDVKLNPTFSDLFLEDEMEKMQQLGGLRRKDDVLELNRLMLRAENTEHRLALLKVLQDTKEPACLRLFLDYHGLALLWSWMVDVPSKDFNFKSQMLSTLKLLPIGNKTILRDSRVLAVVERWAGELQPAHQTVSSSIEKKSDSEKQKTAFCESELPVADGEKDVNSVDDVRLTDNSSLPLKSELDSSGENECGGKCNVDNISSSSGAAVDSIVTSNEECQTAVGQHSSDALSLQTTAAAADQQVPAVVPHKKRHVLLVETASSSDGELAKTEESVSQDDEADNATALASVDTASVCMSHDDDATSVTEDDVTTDHACTAVVGTTSVGTLASALLRDWASLKEAYKIPKLSVEERKKTEQELDRRCEEYQSRKDSSMSWTSSRAQRRSTEDSPDVKRRRRDERSKLSETEEPSKSQRIQRTPKPAPTPLPAMSKEEYRQMFEAQVRAFDIMTQQQQQQQQQQQLPDSTYGDYILAPAASSNTGSSMQYSAGGTTYASDVSLSQIGNYGTEHQISTSVVMGNSTETAYALDPSTLSVPLNTSAVYGLEPDLNAKPVIQTSAVGYNTADLTMAMPTAAIAYGQPIGHDLSSYCQTPLSVQMTPYQQQLGVVQSQQHPLLITHEQLIQQQQPPTILAPALVNDDGFNKTVDTTAGQGIHYNTQTGLYYAVQGTAVMVPQSAYDQCQPTAHIIQIPQSTLSVAPRDPRDPPRDPRDPPPPPPSPPRHKPMLLPPNWKTAKDASGKLYYYHTVTRQTQWEPPLWDVTVADDDDDDDDDDLDIATPTNDDAMSSGHKHSHTTTAAADTSTEAAKRFRAQIAKHVVACLGPYRRPDCEQGRINTTEDFKQLARKLCHAIMKKELKHCRHLEDLEVNENVKGKARNYVVKYMSKYPGVYRPSGNSPF